MLKIIFICIFQIPFFFNLYSQNDKYFDYHFVDNSIDLKIEIFSDSLNEDSLIVTTDFISLLDSVFINLSFFVGYCHYMTNRDTALCIQMGYADVVEYNIQYSRLLLQDKIQLKHKIEKKTYQKLIYNSLG